VPDTTATTDLGARFVEAVSDRDADRLGALFADDIDFRGLTPNRSWEAGDRAAVVDIVLKQWFEPKDEFDEPPQVESDAFADCQRVGYRFRGHNPDGPFVVEQQAYLKENDGRIAWMRVVCTGFLDPG